MKAVHVLTLALVCVLSLCNAPAWALGEETFGNTPLNVANYADHPGLMPVINHESRVYHSWVNGNEQFYYRGGLDTLNAVLRQFSEAQGKDGEIVLRPGPGVTASFQGQEIPFNWNLHMIGGIARHLTTLPEGTKIWSTAPTLTVYVGGDLDPAKIQLPKGTPVVSVQNVKKRVREALKSKDMTVRGWGAGELIALDPYDAEDRDVVAGLLKDPETWVRLNAAGALSVMGKTAEPAVPALREALTTNDEQLKERVQDTLQKIEKAPDRAREETAHRDLLQWIQQIIAARKD